MLNKKEIEEIKNLIQSGFNIELIAFELDIPLDQVKQCYIDLQDQEIKNLLQSGFEVDLISFELDIPIEQVIRCKKELEESNARDINKTTCSDKERKNKESSKIRIKIKSLRDEYNKLYFGNNRLEFSKPKPLSQIEIELIDEVIATIQKNIEEINNLLSVQEKRKIAIKVLSELKKIEKYQLTIPQAEHLYTLLSSRNLNGCYKYLADTIDYAFKKQKRICVNKLAMAVALKQSEVNDIEELYKLERKITAEMINQNPISIGNVRSSILNKIAAIKENQAIDRIKNDIPSSIHEIIEDLTNGNLDIIKANKTIFEEAKKRVESKPKTKFGLTEEQENKQIKMQIINAIREKPHIYQIQYPEKMVIQLQKLCGCQFGVSIGAVVKNLISKKEFNTAKMLCNKFNPKTKENSQTKSTIKFLKNEIRNVEISDIVMTLIKMNGTEEEEMSYFEMIQNGLNMGNVNPAAISLGKSEDGTRNISLADIWTDEVQINNMKY